MTRRHLAALLVCLGAVSLPKIAHAQATFTNSTPIVIPATGTGTTTGSPATPYPSTITVSGMTLPIAKLTLTLEGYSHTFPDDVDVLLVAPDGTKMIVLSDAGDTNDPVNLTITLDDAASTTAPDAGALASGSYRPFNYGTVLDPFPAPSPGSAAGDSPAPGGIATFGSKFNGHNANGVWSLYVVDDAGTDVGTFSGGWSLTITEGTPAPAGALIISEFRLHGPSGVNDEFIEIYNASGASHTVAATSGTGYAVAASDGVTRCTIPNGTVIPNRGHFLCVNSGGYGLGSYPADNGTTATANASYTGDIPGNAGIALFNNDGGGGSFSLANRLDAAGPTTEANTLYREGPGYPALTPGPIDYAFVRDMCGKGGSITTMGPCATGAPIDTNNNAADFFFVDPNGTSAGAGQRLGAPGPENLSGPIQRNASFGTDLLDTCIASASPPNRVRDFTSDPANNSTFGTLDIRRTFTNNTGGNVTRLRFRIIDLTTFPAPSGIADMRPRTSTSVVVTVDRPPCGSGTSNVTVNGTTLEQPPSQPNGGGFNSSLGVGTVTLATPLANGASIDLRFLLGLQQTGNFKIYLTIEALP